jgi:hypothetical protein
MNLGAFLQRLGWRLLRLGASRIEVDAEPCDPTPVTAEHPTWQDSKIMNDASHVPESHKVKKR